MGTLRAVRRSRQAQVLRATPSAESVMRVQTLRRVGSQERADCTARRTATLKEREYDSNKQIHADMEELSDFLCLLLRHGPFSAKDLRHPALGADYGPKIFGG